MDAADWDARYAATDLVWSAEPNRFVAEIIGPSPAGRALDVACGEGRNAIWLARQGWRVTALDFSQVAIDKATRLGEATDAAAAVDVEWIRGDATRLEVPAGAHDLVLICYLQLTDAEMRKVARGAIEALAPGGAVVLIAHALDNLTHGVGGPSDPAVLPTPEQAAGWFAGLTVERAEHVLRPVTTPDGTRDAIDVVVVARRPAA